MHRRAIVVPVDGQALEAVDYDTATPEQVIERLVSQAELDYLYESPLLNTMNRVGKAYLGDYESSQILDMDDLRNVLDYLESFTPVAEHKSFIDDLKRLGREALQRQTGIFFFF